MAFEPTGPVSRSGLTGDPLFQLNALLWLAQPIPAGGSVEPLLYREGFKVHALGPALTLPLNVAYALGRAGLATQGSARPELILKRLEEGEYAIIECKRSSFGPTSSTSEQARVLLAAAGPPCADVLGLPRTHVSTSSLGYLTRDDQRARLSDTLRALSDELRQAGVDPGRSTVVGLKERDFDIALVVEAGASFCRIPAGEYPFIRTEPGTDPRPLYLIPYDPDALPQDESEEVRAKQQLFERVRVALLTRVGQAPVPGSIHFTIPELLSDATWGLFNIWGAGGSRSHVIDITRAFVRALAINVNKSSPKAITSAPDTGWTIALDSTTTQDKVRGRLMRFEFAAKTMKALPQASLLPQD